MTEYHHDYGIDLIWIGIVFLTVLVGVESIVWVVT